MAVEREFLVANERGIHARVAAKIVEVAGRFRSEVWLQKGNVRVNGRSILDILSLACGRGTRVKIEVMGPDEEEAVEALGELFQKKFSEV